MRGIKEEVPRSRIDAMNGNVQHRGDRNVAVVAIAVIENDFTAFISACLNLLVTKQ